MSRRAWALTAGASALLVLVSTRATSEAQPCAQAVVGPPGGCAAEADYAAELDFAPVESVDLPYDRSQLSLAVRGTGPSDLDGSEYQDGSIALSGAITLHSWLRSRSGSLSALRVLAQFRVEGERVAAELLGEDVQVTKVALGITALYLSRAGNFYALYAGASVAESRETLSSPELMPTVIGLGTYRTGKRLTWLYGGGLGYALGRPWLLPAAGVMWRIGRGWSLTTLLPVFLEVRQTFSRKLAANVVVAVSGDRFNFTNEGRLAGAGEALQLRLGQARLGIGVTVRVSRRWSLRGEVGVVGPRKLSILENDATVMSAEGKGAGYVSTMVTYGFGTAPI